MLVEYWVAPGRIAAVWTANNATGVVTRTLTDRDSDSIRQLAVALPGARDVAWRSQAAQIGQLLLAGIPIGASITDFLIIPDGMLHLVPFEALSLSASAPLVVEQFAVSYLPSAALVSAPPQRSRTAAPWSRQLVAFGDPVAPLDTAFPDDRGWSRLPNAASELEHIAAELPAAARFTQERTT